MRGVYLWGEGVYLRRLPGEATLIQGTEGLGVLLVDLPAEGLRGLSSRSFPLQVVFPQDHHITSFVFATQPKPTLVGLHQRQLRPPGIMHILPRKQRGSLPSWGAKHPAAQPVRPMDRP